MPFPFCCLGGLEVFVLKKLIKEALAACPTDEANIYRRRVVWMQEGFAPFFTEADLAHRWLQHPPAAAVPAVARWKTISSSTGRIMYEALRLA